MTTEETSGSGRKPVLITTVLGLLLVAGAIGYTVTNSETSEAPSTDEVVALLEQPLADDPDTQATDLEGDEDAPATAEDGEEIDEDEGAVDLALAATPPLLDIVRVEPDGNTLVAGATDPGVAVAIVVDGEDAAVVEADTSGDFVAFLTLPPSDTPRVLSTEVRLPDGTAVAGEQTVIVAPFALAEITPEPAPEVPATPTPEAAEAQETVEIIAAEEPDQALAEDVASIAPQTDVPDVGDAAEEEVVAANGEEEGVTTDDETLIADAAEQGEAVAGEEIAPETVAGASPSDVAPAEAVAEEVALEEASLVEAAGAEEFAEAPGELVEAPEIVLPDPVTENPDLATVEPGGDTPAIAIANPTAPTVSPTAPQAGEAPAVVIAGPDGLIVTQAPGSPEVQTEIQLDAISYDAAGEVILAGRGPATADIQVFLNNQPIQLGEVGANGSWSLRLPDVDPGTYTLSVAELGSDGSVESRIETPFLREDPDRIAEAPTRGEGQGVDVITVQPGFTLWGIAERTFGDGVLYVQIFEENQDQITDPNWIFPGQIFRLPEMEDEDSAN